MKRVIFLKGNLVTGLGEGKKFMSIKNYRKQFAEKLNIIPYRGTLNVKLSKTNIKKLDLLRKNEGIIINGFKDGDKTFGDVIAYNAKISNIKCVLIMPKLSRHKDIAEIISSKRLRSLLSLKDGSVVKVFVFL